MRRVSHLIEKICDIDNLYLAFYKAQKGKRFKTSVKRFSSNLNLNIENIRAMLMSGAPVLGNYTRFKIFDPKERTICSAAFQERVIHHALINVCQGYFERNLIYHSYATRIGKGVYGAIEAARKGSRKAAYVVKMDVRKYFDTIDHGILKVKLSRLFKDSVLLKIFDAIIDSYCTDEGKGLPIGNLTSQYFANYYLSTFDHYVIENCKAIAYVRYMDDFLVFTKTKEEAIEMERFSRYFIKNDCNLELKPSVITKTCFGVSFLGYRLFPNKILLNKRSKKRLKNKINFYARNLELKVWNEHEYYTHITPLLSFAEKAYTKRLRKRILFDGINESR